ncbi:prolyl-tRNA synthetase, partial [Patescibacteria group bacterium]|nr:prolyl-tRNA synthetase [Patescibacteria group bacterium]
YVDKEKHIAGNKEVYTDDVLKDLNLKKKELFLKKAIEVGNIFSLGTRFSEALGLSYKDKKGEDRLVVMGSYGIGPERVMGTVVEVLSDGKGIVWPESIAPFRIHLIDLSSGNKKVRDYAEELYENLLQEKIEVLFDDRDVRAGEKFADADLIGIPYRAVVSEKTMEEGKIEVVDRKNGKTRMLAEAQLYSL